MDEIFNTILVFRASPFAWIPFGVFSIVGLISLIPPLFGGSTIQNEPFMQKFSFAALVFSLLYVPLFWFFDLAAALVQLFLSGKGLPAVVGAFVLIAAFLLPIYGIYEAVRFLVVRLPKTRH